MGSPRFQLWWNDAAPVLKKGGFAAAAAFLSVGVAPLIGITVDHAPMFTILAGAAGAAIQVAIEFLTDKSKAK
jgi:hypothetical protein